MRIEVAGFVPSGIAPILTASRDSMLPADAPWKDRRIHVMEVSPRTTLGQVAVQALAAFDARFAYGSRDRPVADELLLHYFLVAEDESLHEFDAMLRADGSVTWFVGSGATIDDVMRANDAHLFGGSIARIAISLAPDHGLGGGPDAWLHIIDLWDLLVNATETGLDWAARLVVAKDAFRLVRSFFWKYRSHLSEVNAEPDIVETLLRMPRTTSESAMMLGVDEKLAESLLICFDFTQDSNGYWRRKDEYIEESEGSELIRVAILLSGALLQESETIQIFKELVHARPGDRIARCKELLRVRQFDRHFPAQTADRVFVAVDWREAGKFPTFGRDGRAIGQVEAVVLEEAYRACTPTGSYLLDDSHQPRLFPTRMAAAEALLEP